jgi:hypothetical protein
MNYNESLFFIGECFSLRFYPERKDKILRLIESENVDWEQVVWVGSNHLVLPTLYINLKNAGLISSLPSDLASHLEEITWLNRERNQKIMEQAKEITISLNQHNIAPIFLKGTAHLFRGLYGDIAERMIGDIDFLVPENEMLKAAEVLMSEGYISLSKFVPGTLSMTKHYPRLKNENKVSAVEIHRQPVRMPWDRSFNFSWIDKEKEKLDMDANAFDPSVKHQIIHNILNVQLNDGGFKNMGFYLRQSYDLFLLSKQLCPFNVIMDFGRYFWKLNPYLALSSRFFNDPQIKFKENKRTQIYLSLFFYFNKHPGIYKILRISSFLCNRWFTYFQKIVQACYKKEMRKILYNNLKSPSWYKQHILSYRKIT